MTQQLNSVDEHMQDELLALVAGTLSEPDFERVANAVANDPALQQSLQQLEMIHAGLLRITEPAGDAAAVAATTARVLQQISTTAALPTDSESVAPRLPDFSGWLRNRWVWICLPAQARWAYGAVVAQIAVIVVLTTQAVPQQPDEAGAMRGGSASTSSKQLGVMPGHVLFTVRFAATTPESSLRALLLAIQAEIVSGPNQLGQYKISVARNYRDLAQQRFAESKFVEEVVEIKP